MILDAFLFSDELDLLECRLATLDPVVDRFILCEANFTFQGETKPFHYAENRERFAPWKDKIWHVACDDMPETDSAWDREYYQRDQLAVPLAHCRPDDTFMLSDVDEIPRPECVPKAASLGRRVVLDQRWYSFAVDWQHPETWPGTIVAPVSALIQLSLLRRDRYRMRALGNVVLDAGWHFTWLGDQDRKLRSFSHTELVGKVDLEECYRDGLHVDGTKLLPVEVDGTYPDWMLHDGNVPEQWRRPR